MNTCPDCVKIECMHQVALLTMRNVYTCTVCTMKKNIKRHSTLLKKLASSGS